MVRAGYGSREALARITLNFAPLTFKFVRVVVVAVAAFGVLSASLGGVVRARVVANLELNASVL